MLRTTRQIRTEEDRFGGYSNNAYASEKINRFEAEEEDAFSRTNESFYADIPAPKAKTQDARDTEMSSLYSKRQSAKMYPDTAEFVGNTYVRRPAHAKRDSESVMPTVKTRRVLEEAAVKQTVKKQSSMSVKTKAMLGVYAAVVVVLAAIVIATGIAIGSMSASVEALEAEISYKNTVVTQQSAELAALDNNTMVTGQAVELGMKKPNSVSGIELLPMGETVNYEARTNWFDKFCDWLSNLIGG